MKEKVKTYYIDLVKGKRKGALAALFSFLLLLLSFVYGFFVRLILSCYQTGLLKSYKSPCRTISVGNITWGGTGKTPLVEALARLFKQEGKNPAILIRGYGKDEVFMFKEKLKDIPVLAGRDRIKTARGALKQYAADTIILDDGFQHWRIRRDLDIVLIDASCPFGRRTLIPAGILREPLTSLKRADVFVLTRTELAKENIESIKEELRKYNSQAAIYQARHAPTFLRSLSSDERIELSAIKSEPIAVVSGIANPQSFTKTLESLGAKVSLKFEFPDHYQYRKQDLERIEKACLENQIKILITTEKDAARFAPLLRFKRLKLELLALCIELKIVQDEQKFFRCLLGDKNNQGPYSILVLNDGRAGHLNQSKALAGIIKKRKKDCGLQGIERVSAQIAEVKFKNGFCRSLLAFCSIFSSPVCGRCLFCLRFCLKKDSFTELMNSAADVIVSAGSSLSSVNLLLSYKNKARKVILMKPSFLSLDRFDLVIAPEHDRLKPKGNVLLTRITPNLIERQYLEEQANALKSRIKDSKLTGRSMGVFIGGDTARYRLTPELMERVIFQIKEAAKNLDCRLLVTTSRRTSKAVERLLKQNLADFALCKLLVIANERNIPEAVGGILGLSDIVLVSGESISMVSEAISAEKYVLVFKPEKKAQALSKQERFLGKLEKEGILKIIQPDSLASEIEKIYKDKPERIIIQDKELIYQALGKII